MNDVETPRLDPRLARRIEAKKARLDSLRPLPPNITTELRDSLRLLLTYHSNAIEGNTLTLRETQIVLETGITIGGHPLREHLEATNHAQAFEYMTQVVEASEPLTHKIVLGLHGLVMAGIDDTAGRFRTGPVYIRGASVTPPPAGQVETLIAAWLEWVEGPGRDYHPVACAAIAHHDFEAIHPFFDGNGRVGRLIMNLMLMRDGYPPAILLRSWRGSYLGALDAAHGGRFNPLVNLVGRSVESGLDLYLQAAHVAPNEDYKPLAELARGSEYTSQYLGWLVRQGRLEAVKRAGRWYSTPQALEKYRTSMLPRGRPRRQ